ncbi:MAG: serine hydrolase [Bacteroidota bacterium]|nr:serine hydrolase [Bacteroidota bacterium]
MYITIVVSFLLLFSTISFSNAQAFDSTLAVKLQRTLDSVRTTQNYKGISASVIIPGQGTWLGVSGVSHSNVNITTGMYLGIGSNTKTITSVLVLKLAELNILNIDDSLHRWIPRFQYVDSSISIRQLLNHTSGLFDYPSKPGYMDSILANHNRVWTPEELLIKFLSPPYFPKGQGFYYSNTNYLILGMIVKAATNSQVSVMLRQLIFNPFNLNNTYFAVEEAVPDTIVHPWVSGIDISGRPYTSQLSGAWTAGAIYSTSENMSRWYQLLFGGQVFSQSSLSQMLTFTPQSSYAYGLGIIKYLISGRILWGHSGSIRGYASHMLYDTAMKMSITVLVNQLPGNPVVVSTALLNTVINNPVGIKGSYENIPKYFYLYQNYPNPFNPGTTIKFGLNNSGFTTLKLYDVLGKEVVTLVNEQLKPGTYEVEWNASKYPSGVYFYRLVVSSSKVGSNILTGRMALIK